MADEKKKKPERKGFLQLLRERFRKFKTAGAKEKTPRREGPPKIRTGGRARRLEPSPQQRRAIKRKPTSSRSQTSRR